MKNAITLLMTMSGVSHLLVPLSLAGFLFGCSKSDRSQGSDGTGTGPTSAGDGLTVSDKPNIAQRASNGAQEADPKSRLRVTLTEANFRESVLESSKPVLVEFWAEWCGPCKMLNPILNELAGDYSGRVVFGNVNIDENESIARRYEIKAIPTLIIVKEGKVVAQSVGLRNKRSLMSLLDTQLTNAPTSPR